jgi:L-lactate dehydrogenase complex protein LldG
MKMDSRAETLDRIRRALGVRQLSLADDYRTIPRGYVRDGTLADEERVHMFVDRLEDYNATVHRCSSTELNATIARVLGAREKRRIAVPAGLPQHWISEGLDVVVDAGLGHALLDGTDGVLTGCTVAIALTGTIILTHSAAEGRRALTLVPDYHLCVIQIDQIVETVSEGLSRARQHRPTVITTISGPSATADIEMTRIKGVHGPRTLEVVLVG